MRIVSVGGFFFWCSALVCCFADSVTPRKRPLVETSLMVALVFVLQLTGCGKPMQHATCTGPRWPWLLYGAFLLSLGSLILPLVADELSHVYVVRGPNV